jgi:Bacterial PH domain
MSEYDYEPVRGLPGALPADEQILWQGAPEWRSYVFNALHIRLSVLYFAAIIIWAVLSGDMNSAIGVSMLGSLVVGLSILFAWGVHRTTVYTITTKRIILRIGVALNKCINLPLTEIESANLKMLDTAKSHGSIVLRLKGMPRMGYIMLWPHARSLRVARPQPMLRAIPDAQAVANILLKATQNVQSVAPSDTAPHGQSSNAHIPALGVAA